MKIYEFTVTDKNKFSNEELDELVQSVLQRESAEQKWMPGYEWEQVKTETLGSGEIRYHFQVKGQFEDTGFLDENDRDSDNQFSTDSIAARPAEL